MSGTNFNGLQTDLANLFNDPSRYAKFIQAPDLLSQSRDRSKPWGQAGPSSRFSRAKRAEWVRRSGEDACS